MPYSPHRTGDYQTRTFTGTCGTYITTGIAADAPGQLTLPEGIALIRGHALDLLHLIESVAVQHFPVGAKQLVIGNMLPGLAIDAPIRQQLCPIQCYGAVIQGFHCNLVRILRMNTEDALCAGAEFCHIQHAVAANAYRIDLFPVEAMLCQQLIEAIGITGLEEYQDLVFAFPCF